MVCHCDSFTPHLPNGKDTQHSGQTAAKNTCKQSQIKKHTHPRPPHTHTLAYLFFFFLNTLFTWTTFKAFYWICHNTASVLCSGFVATRKACEILVPLPWIKPTPVALEGKILSLNHWTSRDPSSEDHSDMKPVTQWEEHLWNGDALLWFFLTLSMSGLISCSGPHYNIAQPGLLQQQNFLLSHFCSLEVQDQSVCRGSFSEARLPC